jgi:hypothetical protein
MTKPVEGLKSLIPIRTSYEWADSPPGFFQADTISHDVGSASSECCYSLDLIDVASEWTELWVLPNKAARCVKLALQDILGSHPFPLLGINTDSDSEYINNLLLIITPKISFSLGAAPRRKTTAVIWSAKTTPPFDSASATQGT